MAETPRTDMNMHYSMKSFGPGFDVGFIPNRAAGPDASLESARQRARPKPPWLRETLR